MAERAATSRRRAGAAAGAKDDKAQALAALAEVVPSLFFKLKLLTEALHADDAISTGERGVLRDLVDRGRMSAPALAALRPISRQAIHPLLERLVERGLAAPVTNPRHQRSALFEATRGGRDLMRALRRREAAALARAAEAFSVASLRSAGTTLAQLDALLAREIRGDAL